MSVRSPSPTWVAGTTAASIAHSIEQGLHRGRTAAGESLPTVRELATALTVSPATVAAAYKVLRHRGLVSGHGRRGTLVARRTPSPSPHQEPASTGAVDLASGNPDPALLPPLGPALASIGAEPRLYGAPQQVRAFSTFAAGDFDADGIDARFVAVVGGAFDGIERILREHLRPGDQVAVEDPSLPGLLDVLRAAAFGVVPFGVDDEGPLPPDVEAALRRKCHAIIVTPRAQNPCGAAISQQRARDLQRVLKRHPDVVVIENDYAGPISGAPPVSVAAAARRWAVLRSTSKFLGPDLRVAVMAGDELTIARVQGRQLLGARWVSGILQQLALAMWSDPASGRRIARAAEIYAQRRMALLAALTARGIGARGRSGLNVWVPLVEESSVTRALSERGWAVASGERFRIASPPGIRVTAATLAPPDADRFADALAEALRPSSTGSA